MGARRSRGARVLCVLATAMALVAPAGAAAAEGTGDDVFVHATVKATDGTVPSGVCLELHRIDDVERLGTFSPVVRQCAGGGTGEVTIRRSDLPSWLGENPVLYGLVTVDEPWADTWYGQDGRAWASSPQTYRQGISDLWGPVEAAIVVPRAGHITGRILQGPGKPPVELGAAWAATGVGDAKFFQALAPGGSFSMKVFPGSWVMRYSNGTGEQVSGYTSAYGYTWPEISVRPGETVATKYSFLEWYELNSFVVNGRVEDAVTGKPVANACVYGFALIDHDDDWNGYTRTHWDGTDCPYSDVGARTSAQGRFSIRLRNGFPGDFAVSVVDPSGRHVRTKAFWGGGGPFGQVPAPGTTVSAAMTMQPAAAIRGRVVDSTGKPAKGWCPDLQTVDHYSDVTSVMHCSNDDGWYLAGEIPQEVVARRKTPVGLGRNMYWTSEFFSPGVTDIKKAKKVAVIPGRQVTAPVATAPFD
ncbi:MAG: hypothetical protein U0Q15_00285 [Kineosporiaceae bacterium]